MLITDRTCKILAILDKENRGLTLSQIKLKAYEMPHGIEIFLDEIAHLLLNGLLEKDERNYFKITEKGRDVYFEKLAQTETKN